MRARRVSPNQWPPSFLQNMRDSAEGQKDFSSMPCITFRTTILSLCLTLQTASTFAQNAVATSLSQHDFLYAGESKNRRVFIVRRGQVVWTYDDPAGKGEISDAVLLSNFAMA